ncbi:MAG: cell division control protein Cdc6, partial [Candidatus Aenigmatarchaeota archaeon]
LPTQKIYQMFYDVIDTEERIIILIIDEIDALIYRTGDEILYNITRINQELKKAKISIIGITNDLNLISKLDPRVKSSLNEEEIIFPPYNAIELIDILKQRAKIAFSDDAIEEGVIEKCAALAAQENGDARKALDLLRVAAELAEREGDSKVRLKHVDLAESKIDTDNILEIVRLQPKQSQAILYAICRLVKSNPQKSLNGNSQEIYTSDVIEQYIKICKEHRLKQLTTRRISDLIAELDLFGIISTRIISKGRYGRTRTITLNIPDHIYNKIEKFLEEIFNK